MPRVLFHYIDFRMFCYETEDRKRVEGALRTFPPDESDVNHVESIGHHGDCIIVFSARVERANDVRYVLDRIRDLPDFETLPDELDQRAADDAEFFLRLDKQVAFKGEAHRDGGLILRAKAETYLAKKETAAKNAHDALLDDE